MNIVGSVRTEEEKEELTYISKVILVGKRARELAKSITQ